MARGGGRRGADKFRSWVENKTAPFVDSVRPTMNSLSRISYLGSLGWARGGRSSPSGNTWEGVLFIVDDTPKGSDN